ncbi:MAG: hypothetical protein OEY28_06495, partial [Nitrospira sp.]|nr:hypothetical protein [Nitrospira sp.]
NNFTLSFRSTESKVHDEGGDWERDGSSGADGEITLEGFAFGQLASMETYYQSLKNSGLLPADAVLNVTGYFLGGHLATVFTELHASDVNQTYLFNAAGRGPFTVVLSSESAQTPRLRKTNLERIAA